MDDVTKMLNKAGFDQVLQEMRDNGNAEQEQALMLFSIDHYEEIVSGHVPAFRKELMYAAAKKLNYKKKKSMIYGSVTDHSFALLCPVSDQKDAERICEDERRKIASVSVVAGFDVRLSVSAACVLLSDYEPEDNIVYALRAKLRRDEVLHG